MSGGRAKKVIKDYPIIIDELFVPKGFIIEKTPAGVRTSTKKR
jgi:hypothetical protein